MAQDGVGTLFFTDTRRGYGRGATIPLIGEDVPERNTKILTMIPNTNSAIPVFGYPAPSEENSREYLDVDSDGGIAWPVLDVPAGQPRPHSIRLQLRHPTGELLVDDADQTRIFRQAGNGGVLTYWCVVTPPYDVLPRGVTSALVEMTTLGTRGNTRTHSRVVKTFYLRLRDDAFVRPAISDPRQWLGEPRTARGDVMLAEGATSVDVEFGRLFAVTPSVVLIEIDTDAEADLQLTIEGSVTATSRSGFTVLLNTPPNTGGYRLSWAAWI